MPNPYEQFLEANTESQQPAISVNPYEQFVSKEPTAKEMGAPGLGGAKGVVMPGTKNGIADAFNIKPEDVDTTTGADFLTRMDASFSETDEEIFAKFMDKYPAGKIRRVNIPSYATGGDDPLAEIESRLVFKYNWDDPNEKVKTFEDVGTLSGGDLADIVGPTIKAVPEIIAAVGTRGTSVMGTMGVLFGTSATTHLAEEGIEELRGFDRQTLSQQLGDAFIQGAFSGLTGGTGEVGVKTANILSGRGFHLSPEEGLMLMQYNMTKKHGIPLEEITAAQGAPYSAILQRLQGQSEASSRFMKEKLARQQIAAANAIKALPSMKSSSYEIEEGIKTLLNRQYKQQYSKYDTALAKPEVRATGKEVKSAFTKWVADSKQEVSDAYNAVDNLVENSSTPLVFDLKPVREKIQEVKNSILADVRGDSIPGNVSDTQGLPKSKVSSGGAAVPVNDTPTGTLLGVIKDINRIADGQTDYKVIKELRTRLGSAIEEWPWDASYNKGAAKRLYGVLTDVLMNPTGEVVNAYKPLMARASGMARARFDVLDKSTVRSAIRTDNPAKLAIKFGSPLEMTDEVMEILGKYPDKLSEFRQFTLRNMLMNRGGAINALEEWNRKDPVGLDFLFPNNKEKKQFFDMAYDFDALNNSDLKAMAETDRTMSSIADDIAKGKLGEKDLPALVENLGGANSEGVKMLQESIIRRIVDKAVRIDHDTGIHTVNKTALDNEMEALKKSKAFMLLAREQREKLLGIDAYVKLISPKGADAGTSLETAQLMTGVKHPSTFLKSVHGLGVNEILGRVLSSKTATKSFLGTGKKPIKGRELIATMLITKAFMEKEAGSAGLPAAKTRAEKERQIRNPYRGLQ